MVQKHDLLPNVKIFMPPQPVVDDMAYRCYSGIALRAQLLDKSAWMFNLIGDMALPSYFLSHRSEVTRAKKPRDLGREDVSSMRKPWTLFTR